MSTSVVVHGEISLPVIMPDGPYRVEVNRFVSEVWQRVSLADADGETVYTLPGTLTIREWRMETHPSASGARR